MWRRFEAELSTSKQSGQVLAEAVVVLLLLVVLLVAIDISGRWQYRWLTQWLVAQNAADAVALDHRDLPPGASVTTAHVSRWHSQVMREFSVGHPQWHRINGEGRFAQVAWRLVGAGQASLDKTVSDRIERAPQLWRKSEFASKAVVHVLLPTITAVEAPWESRGSPTEWLRQWQGSTPEAYLRPR